MTIKTALRGTMGIAAAACLLGGGAYAQPGPTSGTAGGPSNGYSGLPQQPPERGNTPSTGGGPMTPGAGTTGRSTTGSDTGSAMDSSGTGSSRSTDTGAMSSTTGSSGQEPAITESVTGRVQKVNRSDRTIEIQGIDRQLKVDSGTDVTRNGSQASFSDLQEGSQVRASFQEGNPAHVQQIEIMGPGGRGDSSGSMGTGSSSSSSGDRADRPGSATSTNPGPLYPPQRDVDRQTSSGSSSTGR